MSTTEIVVVATQKNGDGLPRFLANRDWFREYPEAEIFESTRAASRAAKGARAIGEEGVSDADFQVQVVADYGLESERVLETVRQ